MINKIIGMLFLFCICLIPQQSFGITQSFGVTQNISDYEPYYVGEWGPLWQFPSDHLPIGATVDNFHIAFWNILNKNYLHHIEENTQGLKHSSILSDNVVAKDIPGFEKYNLTKREITVITSLLEMIEHPTHPRSLIALQEVHPDVINYLKAFFAHAGSKWQIVLPPGQTVSQDIYLYNADVFSFMSKDAILYTPPQPKSVFTLTLQDRSTHKKYRFVQSHIPGGPNSPEGCAKFSQEAMRQFDPNMTLILMGDMNQSPKNIDKALQIAAAKVKISQPYRHLPVEYPTHMNTKLEAAWIDNFFVYIPVHEEPKLTPNFIEIYEYGSVIQASHNPEEICTILVPIVNLFIELNHKE